MYRLLLVVILALPSCAVWRRKANHQTSTPEEWNVQLADEMSEIIKGQFKTSKVVFSVPEDSPFYRDLGTKLRLAGYGITTSEQAGKRLVFVFASMGEGVYFASLSVGDKWRASRMYTEDGLTLTPSSELSVMED